MIALFFIGMAILRAKLLLFFDICKENRRFFGSLAAKPLVWGFVLRLVFFFGGGIKSDPEGPLMSLPYTGRLGGALGRLAVLLIPFSTTNFPVVRLHGFCAIRVVLLGSEVRLIGGELGEIGLACLDHLRDCGEAVTDLDLALRERAVAFHRSTEVQAVTLRVGGRSGTVRREQHLLAAVLTALTGFCQCAGHMINSGTVRYTCHNN